MTAEQHPAVRVLTVCGSLQGRSANRAVLDAAAAVATANGARVDDFGRLAEMPAFDPDREDEHLDVVEDWRAQAAAADVVLLAVPEYAGAVAGAVKNAFDWLVGSGGVYRTPVAVLSAGTSGGPNARRMMAQTLTWQGAYVVAELGVVAPRTKSDDAGRITDDATLADVAGLTLELLAAARMTGDELVAAASRVVGALQIDSVHVAPAAG